MESKTEVAFSPSPSEMHDEMLTKKVCIYLSLLFTEYPIHQASQFFPDPGADFCPAPLPEYM